MKATVKSLSLCLLYVLVGIVIGFSINNKKKKENLTNFEKKENFFKRKYTPMTPSEIEQLEFFKNESSQYFDSFDWMKEEEFEEKIENSNWKNCSFCGKMHKTGTENSTPRDVVLGVLYGYQLINVLTFVRSLRSTGSNATIVFMVDDRFFDGVSPIYMRHLDACGVVFLNYKAIHHVGSMSPIKSRFLLCKLFVNAFKNCVDRIVIVDVFDTYFQLDPFRQQFASDKVTLSYENDTLAYNVPNADWMKQIDPNWTLEFYEDKFVLCAGLFYGGIAPMIRFLNRYVDIMFWEQYCNKSNDQAILNFMFYHGFFDFKEVVIDLRGENIVSATKWKFHDSPDYRNYMVLAQSNIIPAIIHQYDRSCPLIRFMNNFCKKIDDWQVTPYGRNSLIIQNCGEEQYLQAIHEGKKTYDYELILAPDDVQPKQEYDIVPDEI